MIEYLQDYYNEEPIKCIIAIAVGVIAVILFSIVKYRHYRRYKSYRKIFDEQCQNSHDTFSDWYLNDNHYFTFSEKEYIQRNFDEFKGATEILLKEYRKNIKDADFYESAFKVMSDFEGNRLNHNKAFKEKQLRDNMVYFDRLLQYPLDQQQREAIVTLEDNCLVISSAGSGKTSTMVAKIKYLVERRKVDPKDLLVITYTRKAAEELSSRLDISGLKCKTFHKVALDIIANDSQTKPTIAEPSLMKTVFYSLMNNDEDFKAAFNRYVLDLLSLMKLEHDYDNAPEYYAERKKYGIMSLFRDMNGNVVFTKSEEEKRICAFLTKWSVDYKYEEPYEQDTRTPDYRQYKPDFSIYYKDSYGNNKRIYLEHFGVDKNQKVPLWFGDGKPGGWSVANLNYNLGIDWKLQTHKDYHTTLLATTSAMFHDGSIYDNLKHQLEKAGVPLRLKSEEEIKEELIHRNKTLEKTVSDLIFSFVTLMKANRKTIDELIQKMNSTPNYPEEWKSRNSEILNRIMLPFYNAYEKELTERGEIDFTDCILKATDICSKGNRHNYKYILVDEFQDISVDRYKLLQSLRTELPLTKLFCVGDDWQSIYRFSGSDMSLFNDFEKYFGFTEKCKIETTYRFFNPLINLSSKFILKNPAQVKKDVHPYTETKHTGLSFHAYSDFFGVDKELTELNLIQSIFLKIPKDESILFLGRYGYDARIITDKISDDNKSIELNLFERKVKFMTVHSAKGLEADNVIILNCNSGIHGFPSLIADDPILDLVLANADAYENAEERRVFYVAITRAKKHTYVLFDKRHPSVFIDDFIPPVEEGAHLCPICKDGHIELGFKGTARNGNVYRIYDCSNRSAKCPFNDIRWGDDDKDIPGIDTTGMTMEEINKLIKG